jgi:hypothetical protein
VGRTRLKAVSAGAKNLHCGVFGMNLFLGHLSGQTFPAILFSIVGGFRQFSNCRKTGIRDQGLGIRNQKQHFSPLFTFKKRFKARNQALPFRRSLVPNP